MHSNLILLITNNHGNKVNINTCYPINSQLITKRNFVDHNFKINIHLICFEFCWNYKQDTLYIVGYKKYHIHCSTINDE